MKFIVFLINSIVVCCLMLYDYRIFVDVSDTIKIIEKINQVLDQRGKERYEVQKHLTDWLDNRETQASIRNNFIAGPFLQSEEPVFPKGTYKDQWANFDKLVAAREKINYLKKDYYSISFDELEHSNSLELIRIWCLQMVSAIDHMQKLDVELSNYLSNRVNQSLHSTVFLTASILVVLFAFTLLFIYLLQRKNINEIKEANTALKMQQSELKKSKVMLLSLMQDLTDEKDAATQLSKDLKNANNNLKRKNDEMEEFIYTVSHDLKAPLVTIGGYANKLNSELSNILNEKQQHRLNRIQMNVEHMESLLRDLLQLSRVIKQKLEKKQVNVTAVVDGQIEALGDQILQAEATVDVNTPLQTIYANERLLSQCVINLLTNAIKYRDPERALIIKISTKIEGDTVCLAVEDNGLGIEPKYQKRIFRIFERLEHGEGTGVGLTIVKKIMDKHNGRVALISEKGRGSQFQLIFPLPKNAE